MATRLHPRNSQARADAKASGRKRYFTGNACPNGHVAERYTSTGSCCQCIEESTKRQADGGYFKKRYEEKKVEILAAQRAKNSERSEYVCQKAKAWAALNPERVREIKLRSKAKRRSSSGVFSTSDVKDLMRIQRGECACCSTKLSVTGFEIDHIIPICRGGTNFRGNLQLLCPRCNRRKSSRLPIEFKARILPRMLGHEAGGSRNKAA